MGKSAKINQFTTFASEPLSGVEIKSIAIIVNPMSGGKTGLKILSAIKPQLEEKLDNVEVHYTEYASHARELARDLDLSNIDCLAAIGGDGTAHEIVNGFLARSDDAKEKVILGIIPGGSGNTFAFDLKVTSPASFVKQLLSGNVHAIDAVEITKAASTDGQAVGNPGEVSAAPDKKVDLYPTTCYSINMIGWGLPAAVLQAANGLRWCGAAQYNVAAYTSLVKNAAYRGTISMVNENDEKVEIKGAFVMVQAQSTVHMGDKMPFCPKAKLDDGLIDLVVIRHAGRLSLINIMEKAKQGKHIHHKKVESYLCKSFTITPTAKETFKGENTVNVDGELVGFTPMHAKAMPGAVQFITG